MVALMGGLVALLLGIISLIAWWDEFIVVVMGCIPVVLLMGGALATYLGLEEARDKQRAEFEAAREPFNPDPQEVDKYKQEVAELKAKLASMEEVPAEPADEKSTETAEEKPEEKPE